jgi:hypothetical protein
VSLETDFIPITARLNYSAPVLALRPEAIFADLSLDLCGIEEQESIEKWQTSRIESDLCRSKTSVRLENHLIAEESSIAELRTDTMSIMQGFSGRPMGGVATPSHLDSIFHCISPDLITELENCTNT